MKRPFLLLEVMIAFAILALASIPLIYPHLMILKEERALIEELNFDFAAKNIISNLLVDLYENNVPLKTIEDHGTMDVTKEKLQAVGIPEGAFERAYFQFDEYHKPKGPSNNVLYYVDATLFIKYSAITKERLHKEGASFPVSFLIEKNIKEKENAPEK